MILQHLYSKNIIHCPSWLMDNTQYLVQMGSNAYGVNNDDSDNDVYGWVIPPKEDVFPHLRGEIQGFGKQKKNFEQWMEHHIFDENKKEYDFTVYSVIKYFQLTMENNPNMIDSLFVPQRCVIHSTRIGNMVREKRNIFLHKGCYHKLLGYCFSQKNKMMNKEHKFFNELIEMENELNIPHTTSLEEAKTMNHPEYVELYQKMVDAGKRSERVKIDGFDRKFAYHIIRLCGECEEILTTGNLTLDEIGRRETMKSVRRGEWSIEKINSYFDEQEIRLRKLYDESKLQYSPNEDEIKNLLFNVLEEHYGTISKSVIREDKTINALKEIIAIAQKNL